MEQHNGDPTDNFRIYYDQQRADQVLHPSIPNEDFATFGWRVKGSPEPVVLATDVFVNNGDGTYTINGVTRSGLTNAQARTSYGVSAGGELPPAHAVAGDVKGVYGGVVATI